MCYNQASLLMHKLEDSVLVSFLAVLLALHSVLGYQIYYMCLLNVIPCANHPGIH